MKEDRQQDLFSKYLPALSDKISHCHLDENATSETVHAINQMAELAFEKGAHGTTPLLSKALSQSEPNNEVIGKPKAKFGRSKFKKKVLAEGEVAPDNRKIKAVKKEQDGIQFDSTLELYMYNILKQNGIRFEMKVSYTLQEEFVYLHEKVKAMIVTPDYILIDHDIIIDTKGFANEQSPMRYKLLKHKLFSEGTPKRILLPSNQSKCRHLIECIKQGYFTVEEPISEFIGTRRKNKLKANGWVNLGGYWEAPYPVNFVKGYEASFIMSLQDYDFQELLIKHK